MDYFTKLAQRALGVTPGVSVVQPLIPSRFEVGADTASMAWSPIDETIELARTHAERHMLKSEDGMTPATARTTRSLEQQLARPSSGRMLSPTSGDSRTDSTTESPASECDRPAEIPIVTRRPETPADTTLSPSESDADTATPNALPATTQRNGAQFVTTTAYQSASEMFAEQTAPSAASAPIIRVTIGRVEVRAVSSLAPAPRQTTTPKPSSSSLEDYLRGERGEHRP
jgi:hypothetical protein